MAQFELVEAAHREGTQSIPITNFSYMQVWNDRQTGFQEFFTRYGDPAQRTLFIMRSADGVTWDAWQWLAAIGEGHFQVSGLGQSRVGTMFNFHPKGKGLNRRTNLYYVETSARGDTWHTADQQPFSLPLTTVENAALVSRKMGTSCGKFLPRSNRPIPNKRNHPECTWVRSGWSFDVSHYTPVGSNH